MLSPPAPLQVSCSGKYGELIMTSYKNDHGAHVVHLLGGIGTVTKGREAQESKALLKTSQRRLRQSSA
eukprot:992392-Amphidinium_carterae.1